MKITCSTERPCINCFAGHVDQCLGPYKEKYAQEIPRWLFDLIDSGDLEPILMHYGEENLRLEFYKLRQERLTPNAELTGQTTAQPLAGPS